MRIQAPTAVMISLTIAVTAAIGVGCGPSGSSRTTDLTSPTSSAAGTQVKQPLGASSAGGAGTRPAPAH